MPSWGTFDGTKSAGGLRSVCAIGGSVELILLLYQIKGLLIG